METPYWEKEKQSGLIKLVCYITNFWDTIFDQLTTLSGFQKWIIWAIKDGFPPDELDISRKELWSLLAIFHNQVIKNQLHYFEKCMHLVPKVIESIKEDSGYMYYKSTKGQDMQKFYQLISLHDLRLKKVHWLLPPETIKEFEITLYFIPHHNPLKKIVLRILIEYIIKKDGETTYPNAIYYAHSSLAKLFIFLEDLFDKKIESIVENFVSHKKMFKR